MTATVRNFGLPEQVDPYEEALQRALADLSVTRDSIARAREEITQAEQKESQLIGLVNSLMGMIPEHRRAIYAKDITELRTEEPQPARGGVMFDNVIKLFRQMPQRRDWTVSGVKEELEKQTGPVDSKALHNVLYYLHRRGDLQRVGRGMYRVKSSGIGIYSDDALLDHMTRVHGGAGN